MIYRAWARITQPTRMPRVPIFYVFTIWLVHSQRPHLQTLRHYLRRDDRTNGMRRWLSPPYHIVVGTDRESGTPSRFGRFALGSGWRAEYPVRGRSRPHWSAAVPHWIHCKILNTIFLLYSICFSCLSTRVICRMSRSLSWSWDTVEFRWSAIVNIYFRAVGSL